VRRFEEAIACHEQDIAICRETGDRYGEGQTLDNLGNAYQEMGESGRAAACWREAAEAARDVGDHDQAAHLEELAANAQSQRRRWRRLLAAQRRSRYCRALSSLQSRVAP
jgi:tetratricopeptide (TPR) repeat protein